ncbi:AbrB family transcriptional regulator [Halomonas sp. NyZ770]|uniref:Ammonia monooxygenase n=1 Tax=Vreelandella hamiltonii TaxID=502829 RepID=A0A8H9MAN3_9GAMM|nr:MULTISPECIES: AbrB family transcriptional regulator [Halomonas]ATH76275.1 ammonia monooxygenase [Halomonas hydrothermalis]NGO89313.1 AbrB family transcriptional regulator [Halomonas sp.]KHJ52444.1 ammonia monooxygenase [Halomonas hydrothermalis]UDM08207.1 AbrB family transcriptional regulator [Halomonas sp. NyZ770]GHD54518.1 ammonia monooxygenase [Halomonas hamiltonii]
MKGSRFSAASARALAVSLGVGALGGLLFQLLNLPLAWMLGPLVANLLASAKGASVAVPEPLRNVFLAVMGLVLGSQVTPELAHRVLDWPLSAALLLLGVAASTAVASAWYRRCGFDPVSAWFGAAPGAMTAMILLGEKCGGDPQRIAVAQSLRIILVILFLPPLFWAFEGGEGSLGPAASSLEHGWMLLTIPLLIPLGRWLRIPSSALLTPLLMAALLSGLDLASLALPQWGMNLMLWVLGSAIGSRFQGMTRRLLGRYLWQSGVATLLALMALAVFAELIHRTVGVGRDVALLALAPGGIGEMAILAVALDIDPVFVAFHHLLRMITLMVFAPFWARWLLSRRRAH